ncbi:hypothetical protein CJD38_07230 [Stenotrophobium rhamnosiphilum]|uniref:Uncharacterized protein n=1 Tax=Stenotrophobium rhamnosiphilum TaxID=2029166 RepID=A0A2T5MIN8_9GAMM|nr:hypothetical protein CJD38_07230 [Stenotrophobium rhamnosiphilum]
MVRSERFDKIVWNDFAHAEGMSPERSDGGEAQDEPNNSRGRTNLDSKAQKQQSPNEGASCTTAI